MTEQPRTKRPVAVGALVFLPERFGYLANCRGTVASIDGDVATVDLGENGGEVECPVVELLPDGG